MQRDERRFELEGGRIIIIRPNTEKQTNFELNKIMSKTYNDVEDILSIEYKVLIRYL